MRVLVITNLFPNKNEPQRAMYNRQYISELSKLCQLKVIAPIAWFPLRQLFGKVGRTSQIPRNESIDDIEIYHPRYLMVPKIGRSFYGVLLFLSILPTILRLRGKFGFDITFATWAYPDGFAAVLLSKLLCKPVITKVHGTDINEFTRYYLRKKMIVFALRNSWKVISVSNALKFRMMDIGVSEEKIKVISNGVDKLKFKPMDKLKVRQRIGLPLDKRIILFVGNLVPIKGLNYLVDAFHIIRKDDVNTLLILIGNGTLRNALENRVIELDLEGFVRFEGVKPHNEISLWMNACDLLCLPSLNEGCPNVILEALACGKPVVASNVGDIPDIITGERYGILVPPADSVRLAEAIQIALRRHWDIQIIGESRPGWDEVAQETMREFRECVES